MKKKAFTLIEILVVVAIIGILATVIIINVSGAKAKAIDTKIKTDIISIGRAYRLAEADGGSTTKKIGYTSYGLVAEISGTDLEFLDSTGKSLMSKVPAHPIKGKAYYGKFITDGTDFDEEPSPGRPAAEPPTFAFFGELSGNRPENSSKSAYTCYKGLQSNNNIICGKTVIIETTGSGLECVDYIAPTCYMYGYVNKKGFTYGYYTPSTIDSRL